MEISVSGIDETCEMLTNAPREVVAKGYTRALNAAGAVVKAELAKDIPKDTGLTASQVRARVTLDAALRGGTADVDFSNRTYIAFFVEYGHRLVRGGRLRKDGSGGGKVTGRVPAHPFIRKAAMAAEQAAIDAFSEALAQELQRAPIGTE